MLHVFASQRRVTHHAVSNGTWSLITYQHLASDLMISCKTPQDGGTIFTQQQLWHLSGGGNCVNGYFESFTHWARATYLYRECVREREIDEKERQKVREASLTPVKVRSGSSCRCR